MGGIEVDKAGLRPVDVVIIGSPHVRACSGCNAGRTMEEMAQALGRRLTAQFGSLVKYRYIDAAGDDLEDFPNIAAGLDAKQMALPVALVNGRTVMPGMFSPTMVIYHVKQELRRQHSRRTDSKLQ